MERRYILHLLTPARQVSPFDVNMAVDAGFDVVVPYCDVTVAQVAALTQDAIFSRGPKGVARTALFIGGRDIVMAADMLDAARGAMVPPFAVSALADPSGAYTTAAALVAATERALRKAHDTGLDARRVLVLGGTGPVGRVAGVLLTKAGARVRIGSRRGVAHAEEVAAETNRRFDGALEGAATDTADSLSAELAAAEIVLAVAAAGVCVLGAADRIAAQDLLVVADVNAVPPAGIEGVDVMDDGKPLPGGRAVGIGALAIGNLKYQVEQRLLQSMRDPSQPQYLALDDAFAMARSIARGTA